MRPRMEQLLKLAVSLPGTRVSVTEVNGLRMGLHVMNGSP